MSFIIGQGPNYNMKYFGKVLQNSLKTGVVNLLGGLLSWVLLHLKPSK